MRKQWFLNPFDFTIMDSFIALHDSPKDGRKDKVRQAWRALKQQRLLHPDLTTYRNADITKLYSALSRDITFTLFIQPGR